MRAVLLPLFFSFLFYGSAKADLIDRSHTAFIPKQIHQEVAAQGDFPVLWWNFLILNPTTVAPPAWDQLKDDCEKWRAQNHDLIRVAFCGSDMQPFIGILRAWSDDFVLRHPRPPNDRVKAQMNEVLAQASLPIGPLVQLLRLDPFGSLTELKKIFDKQLHLPFEQTNGFLYDPKTRRVLIPVQFNFPPSQTQFMGRLQNGLNFFCRANSLCHPLFIGAHASTFENETQVKGDLGKVSIVSAFILFLLVSGIVTTGRWRVLLILPPIFLSVGIAALCTILAFGKIHGLCLAFGPAIVGLSIDFGLHVAFSNHARHLWRANLFGLLTTISVLIVMFFSEIPLLQQLMFFSIVGLSFGYLAQYFMFRKWPGIFSAQAYPIKAKPSFVLSILIFVLVGASIVGPFFTSLTLDMRALNFEAPERTVLARWLYESSTSLSPLLQVYPSDEQGSPLERATEQKIWGEQNGIAFNGIANFLPTVATQQNNLKTWQKDLCPEVDLPLSDTQKKFFAPYFSGLNCRDLKPRSLSLGAAIPDYVAGYGHGTQWLTLWFPIGQAEIQKVKTKYPHVSSFSELAQLFPTIFNRELRWMLPAAFAIAFALLLFYYRHLSLALLATTPFFSGLGLYFLMSFIFHFSTNFISVIGLIMVFGFSLDYGIFATDLMQRQKQKLDDGIWSGLSIGTLTNIAGFMPLVFCKHPVLNGLGETLLCGTIGTFLGSIWGIPRLHRWLART